MLNYLYVLLNVKKENQLNQIEESVLNGFIVNNYKNFTIEEIKHAFRLAVSGELGIEMFQKLDSITFGKVLLNYKDFKNNKIKNHIMKKKKIEKKPTKTEIDNIYNEFKENCIIPYIEDRKKMTKPVVNQEIKTIFEYYWNKGLIKMSDDEKQQYKTEANKLWKEYLIEQKSAGEKINIESPMGNRTLNTYLCCVAIYHKINDIIELDELKNMSNDDNS